MISRFPLLLLLPRPFLFSPLFLSLPSFFLSLLHCHCHQPGDFADSEIIVLLGENGTGKTTFIRMLAGLLKSDEEEKDPDGDFGVPELNISYKPQKISPKFEGTVRTLLHKRIRDAYVHPQFISDVMKPMKV